MNANSVCNVLGITAPGASHLFLHALKRSLSNGGFSRLSHRVTATVGDMAQDFVLTPIRHSSVVYPLRFALNQPGHGIDDLPSENTAMFCAG